MDKKWKIRAIIFFLPYLFGSIGIFLVLGRYFSISDITGVGQLFADILLFPTVIIGFWIAVTEFRKSQASPSLKLRWRGDKAVSVEKDYLILEISKYTVKQFSLFLFVKNEGKAIATWYRLAFDIPSELARPNSETHSVRWHQGDENCWSSGINTKMTRHEFKSNGQYVLYPDEEEIHIATIEIQVFPQVVYPSRAYIPYSVVTDKTQIRYGICKIRVRPPE
jgi:hypothetical protein